jgi:hypothetical protein
MLAKKTCKKTTTLIYTPHAGYAQYAQTGFPTQPNCVVVLVQHCKKVQLISAPLQQAYTGTIVQAL